MKKAKRITFILAMVLMLGTSAIPVQAHGSEHKTTRIYSQCTKNNCSKTGVHTHNEENKCGNKTIESGSGHKSSSSSKQLPQKKCIIVDKCITKVGACK